VFYPGTKLYYIWRNKQKRKQWEALTPEVRRPRCIRDRAETDCMQEQSEYLRTTKEVGNRRLDFQFAH
jgi:hypothetical protein